tara:strand:+ start:57566 stop:59155 length:1590 start_codon:yes stop_codon:yes gene_type:complete
MKNVFKPLALASAVAAVSAGYAGVVNAEAVLADNSGLGDLAIVPYYTVREGYSTGVSVVNTSNETQVIKIRLRRAVDSMDALDFNVIMSPWDVWNGYIQADGDDIRFYSNDASCTAPAMTDGSFLMPNIYREGAEEGYIEVIGMGAASNAQPISAAALHVQPAGVPASCDLVRDNFFPGDNNSDYGTGANLARRGVIDSETSHQRNLTVPGTFNQSKFTDTGNVLKVSYFIKSDATGTEFGDDAVHLANFMTGPSITNQKFGINQGDLQGFDYPDLNGGAVFGTFVDPVAGAGERPVYQDVRSAIGGVAVINNWSANTTDMFTVDTDWVVTTPGQYNMTNLWIYADANDSDPSGDLCTGGVPGLNNYVALTGANCDFRDIPLTATFAVFDREERGIVIQEGDLVVSPQPPNEVSKDTLRQEVNVISWGTSTVLGAQPSLTVKQPDGAQAGWAKMGVSQWAGTQQAICSITGLASPNANAVPTQSNPMPVLCVATDTPVPLVGFVAWQRNFGVNADANYGRIVGHSYSSN